MTKHLLAIDQSTSATKAILFDERLHLIARSNVVHRQMYPRAGWAEHDPVEIYQNLLRAVRNVLEESNVNRESIVCLSISNQRETTLLWDAQTGLPVYNAIVWQCNRGQEITKRPQIRDRAAKIQQRTGVPLSPYFSAAKAGWIVENADIKGKRLLFGTIDAWLIWKLTGKHRTDYSNASRTQLFNIHTLSWDREMIEMFGLRDVAFPEVCFADTVFGETTLEGIFASPIPLVGVLGDSHGAMFGQQCWEQGTGKCTFGTGTSVMMNIGDTPVLSQSGIATSIAWGVGGRVEYVFEGNINYTGDTLNWLINELGVLPNAAASEEYAQKLMSNEGVYLVPAFSGLSAPHYNSDARAVICGLFRDAGKYHVVRAALEAIAYQICDVVEPMTRDAGMEFAEIRVDGGPTKNRFLMQFVADIVRARIVRNEIEELSALGVASTGGLGIGLFASREALASLRRAGECYLPQMDTTVVRELYEGWKSALQKTY